MKVYVVEKGVYEARHIAGVYATIEAAIAAHPVPREPKVFPYERAGGWQREGESQICWWNGLDGDDDIAQITEYDVQEVAHGQRKAADASTDESGQAGPATSTAG
jgi:hypothetical protein